MYRTFDQIARTLADESLSRRETLRRIGGGVFATVFGGSMLACDSDSATSPAVEPRYGVQTQGKPAGCRDDNGKCRNHSECCSGYCDGTGTCGCKSGTTNCGGTCTYVSMDHSNCGACGNVCAPDELCSNGVCTSVVCCPVGQEYCGGTCRNFSSDRNNCGACGNACPTGQNCYSGTCSVCAPGESVCSGQCADLMNDPDNCGACGAVCAYSVTQCKECIQGVCTVTGPIPACLA